MLRFICRPTSLSKPRSCAPTPSAAVLNRQHCQYSSKAKQNNNKSKSKQAESVSFLAQSVSASLPADDAARIRARLSDVDERDSSLDVGPNGRPLFTASTSLSSLTRHDACTYFKFSEKQLKAAIPEGLPASLVTEFRESMRPALLERKSFVDLRDNFIRIVDSTLS